MLNVNIRSRSSVQKATSTYFDILTLGKQSTITKEGTQYLAYAHNGKLVALDTKGNFKAMHIK